MKSIATVLNTPTRATPRGPSSARAPWLAERKTAVPRTCIRNTGAPSFRIELARALSRARWRLRMRRMLVGPWTKETSRMKFRIRENVVASAAPAIPQCSTKIAMVARIALRTFPKPTRANPSPGRPCTRRMFPIEMMRIRNTCPTALIRKKGTAISRTFPVAPEAARRGRAKRISAREAQPPSSSPRRTDCPRTASASSLRFCPRKVEIWFPVPVPRSSPIPIERMVSGKTQVTAAMASVPMPRPTRMRSTSW